MNEELLKRLDLLAAKLGTTGEKVWDILVRQAQVEAAFSLAQAVVFLGLSYACYRVCKWGLSDEINAGEAVILPFLGGLVFFAIGLFCLFETRWYFMPEARALQQLLGAIR